MSNLKPRENIELQSALAALEGIQGELLALTQEELLQQNIVPLSALVTVRGIYRALLGLREQMLRLPDFDIVNVDRLELYAAAFAGAQARFNMVKQRNRRPAALFAEALAARRQLRSDVIALVRRQLIPSDLIQNLSGRRGYEQVAADLLLLAAVLRARMTSIVGKCAVTEEELVCAEVLAHQLTCVVSHRREPVEAQIEAADARRRAFTLFFRAYGQVRRAVQYLRYEQGDAERIAPALSGKRRGGKKAKRNQKSKQNASQLESERVAEIETRVTTPPSVSAPASGVVAAVPDAVAVSDVPARIGLPGSDPFIH